MAIQEYTNESVNVLANEFAIVVNGSEISGDIEEGPVSIATPTNIKIVVGTSEAIDQYIVDNNLTYEVISIPSETE